MQLNKFGEIIYKSWVDTPKHFMNVEMGPFVVMPNHFHGIITITDGLGRGTACCAPTDDNMSFQRFGDLVPGSLPVIVRSFKSVVTNHIHKSQLNIQTPIWQRNYYERIIRGDDDYTQIAAYIEFNPDNWSTDEENPDRQLLQ
jgi:REP element-mobilizing transposase RayT